MRKIIFGILKSVFPKEYVIEHGTCFDGEKICWSDEFEDLICDEENVPFNGLLYELYNNGNLAYYAFYENGLRNGIDIEFYISGGIKSYGIFTQGAPAGKSYEWYENGMIKKTVDHYKGDYHYKYIKYDENGNITKQGEV